jgi:tetratricopeptide (TPR) repeat protein
MNNPQRAIVCFESTLQHNPHNPDALRGLANIYRSQEDFVRGADYFMRALAVRDTDGEMWGSLGHCYLMTDDLPKAYNCYQQAIINSVDSKNEPKLWYGIGILYDRYGSLDHAEEAFASVIKMDPSTPPGLYICALFLITAQTLTAPTRSTSASASSTSSRRTRGRVFRCEGAGLPYTNALTLAQCFQYILSNPPRPLTEIDIWFQIGHVYEQQQEVRTRAVPS